MNERGDYTGPQVDEWGTRVFSAVDEWGNRVSGGSAVAVDTGHHKKRKMDLFWPKERYRLGLTDHL